MIVVTYWMVLFLLLNIFFTSVNALPYIPICLILLSVSYYINTAASAFF